MNRFRDVFPSTPSELAAMLLCYSFVGLMFWMVCNADQVGAFLRGWFA